jgi:hypothetical protein
MLRIRSRILISKDPKFFVGSGTRDFRSGSKTLTTAGSGSITNSFGSTTPPPDYDKDEGDACVCVAQMVLASCSPYFYAMFTGFTERESSRVTIQQVFKAFLGEPHHFGITLRRLRLLSFGL